MDSFENPLHTSIETGVPPEIAYDVTLSIIHSEGVYALTAVRCTESPDRPKFEIVISLEEKAGHPKPLA